MAEESIISELKEKPMSFRVEAAVTINAPCEYVWKVIQDPTRRKEWDERVISVRQLTPGSVEKGAQLEVITRMYGVNFVSVLEFVNWKPCSRSGVKSLKVSGGISGIVGSWNFDQNPDGSTTWTTALVITESPGLFGWMMKSLLASTFEQMTLKSQKNLKRLIEGEYRALHKIKLDLTAHVVA